MNQTPQTDSFEVLCPLFLSMPYMASFFIKKTVPYIHNGQ